MKTNIAPPRNPAVMGMLRDIYPRMGINAILARVARKHAVTDEILRQLAHDKGTLLAEQCRLLIVAEHPQLARVWAPITGWSRKPLTPRPSTGHVNQPVDLHRILRRAAAIMQQLLDETGGTRTRNAAREFITNWGRL